MDYDELEDEQNEIDEEISEIADENGLNYEFKPMPDGICDISAYLDARVKIMWVLKEPYIKDNYWCSLRELFSEYPYTTNISNRTHQYMACIRKLNLRLPPNDMMISLYHKIKKSILI